MHRHTEEHPTRNEDEYFARQNAQLIKEMRAQAGRFGTEYLQGDVSAVDLKRTPFILTIGGERTIETRTLIIASLVIACR